MSKSVKTVASIALPIIGNFFLPGIGGAIGGALGGAISGGGLRGAALGAIGGYASGSLAGSIFGKAAGAPLSAVTGVANAAGPTVGSGIAGAVTGGGLKALGSGLASAATSAAPSLALASVGNQIFAQGAANDAKKAAYAQADAIDRATATQAPYNQLGANAAAQIQQIQSNPNAYIQNNPFYKSLADDAEQRLLAREASRGKIASGGTASALQDQLLQLGNGLVQQQVGTLQNQVNSGQGAANNVSLLQQGKGNVKAASTIAQGNALSSGYQNQINTLLALQNTPSYQPMQMMRL